MRECKLDIYRYVADSPRKSYLGKARRLTPSQDRWVRAIISLWAGEMKDDSYLGLSWGSGSIWRFVTGWSGENIERFTKVFEQLKRKVTQEMNLKKKPNQYYFQSNHSATCFSAPTM